MAGLEVIDEAKLFLGIGKLTSGKANRQREVRFRKLLTISQKRKNMRISLKARLFLAEVKHTHQNTSFQHQRCLACA